MGFEGQGKTMNDNSGFPASTQVDDSGIYWNEKHGAGDGWKWTRGMSKIDETGNLGISLFLAKTFFLSI